MALSRRRESNACWFRCVFIDVMFYILLFHAVRTIATEKKVLVENNALQTIGNDDVSALALKHALPR